ncbi:MAG: hypothetical protein K1Y02_20975 [Candidatus Hydrogenedentes bacterium]|nr:hypothetical protein [Candidatus Hydrogenedentota bacterium]
MKVQCCVCHKTRIGGVWVATATTPATDESISHGYCPPCAEAAFAELRAASKQGSRRKKSKDAA